MWLFHRVLQINTELWVRCSTTSSRIRLAYDILRILTHTVWVKFLRYSLFNYFNNPLSGLLGNVLRKLQITENHVVVLWGRYHLIIIVFIHHNQYIYIYIHTRISLLRKSHAVVVCRFFQTASTLGANSQSLGCPAIVEPSVPRNRAVGKHPITRRVSVRVCACLCFRALLYAHQ